MHKANFKSKLHFFFFLAVLSVCSLRRIMDFTFASLSTPESISPTAKLFQEVEQLASQTAAIEEAKELKIDPRSCTCKLNKKCRCGNIHGVMFPHVETIATLTPAEFSISISTPSTSHVEEHEAVDTKEQYEDAKEERADRPCPHDDADSEGLKVVWNEDDHKQEETEEKIVFEEWMCKGTPDWDRDRCVLALNYLTHEKERLSFLRFLYHVSGQSLKTKRATHLVDCDAELAWNFKMMCEDREIGAQFGKLVKTNTDMFDETLLFPLLRLGLVRSALLLASTLSMNMRQTNMFGRACFEDLLVYYSVDRGVLPPALVPPYLDQRSLRVCAMFLPSLTAASDFFTFKLFSNNPTQVRLSLLVGDEADLLLYSPLWSSEFKDRVTALLSQTRNLNFWLPGDLVVCDTDVAIEHVTVQSRSEEDEHGIVRVTAKAAEKDVYVAGPSVLRPEQFIHVAALSPFCQTTGEGRFSFAYVWGSRRPLRGDVKRHELELFRLPSTSLLRVLSCMGSQSNLTHIEACNVLVEQCFAFLTRTPFLDSPWHLVPEVGSAAPPAKFNVVSDAPTTDALLGVVDYTQNKLYFKRAVRLLQLCSLVNCFLGSALPDFPRLWFGVLDSLVSISADCFDPRPALMLQELAICQAVEGLTLLFSRHRPELNDEMIRHVMAFFMRIDTSGFLLELCLDKAIPRNARMQRMLGYLCSLCPSLLVSNKSATRFFGAALLTRAPWVESDFVPQVKRALQVASDDTSLFPLLQLFVAELHCVQSGLRTLPSTPDEKAEMAFQQRIGPKWWKQRPELSLLSFSDVASVNTLHTAETNFLCAYEHFFVHNAWLWLCKLDVKDDFQALHTLAARAFWSEWDKNSLKAYTLQRFPLCHGARSVFQASSKLLKTRVAHLRPNASEARLAFRFVSGLAKSIMRTSQEQELDYVFFVRKEDFLLMVEWAFAPTAVSELQERMTVLSEWMEAAAADERFSFFAKAEKSTFKVSLPSSVASSPVLSRFLQGTYFLGISFSVTVLRDQMKRKQSDVVMSQKTEKRSKLEKEQEKEQ